VLFVRDSRITGAGKPAEPVLPFGLADPGLCVCVIRIEIADVNRQNTKISQPGSNTVKQKTRTQSKQQSSSSGSTSQQREKPMAEVADKTIKNYEQAVRTGLKLQEEAARCWTHMVNQTAAPQDLYKQFSQITSMTNGVLPAAQRRMEAVMELMEQNSRTGAELIRKATAAVQTTSIAESQGKWLDFWTSSMSATRTNAEAITQIGTRYIDTWIDFVRQNTEVAQVRVPKSA